MPDTLTVFALLVLLFMVAASSFATGWEAARSNKTPITIQSIEKYLEENFPDKWAAYKKGVNEGYEQGLRDGQEMPNESS